MNILKISGVLVALGCAGCVQLPQFDPDLACTIPTHTETEALAVMQARSVALTHTPFVAGNKVVLLENGPATYGAMLAAMAAATDRIDMESYEFDGDVAEKFADMMIAKQAQGVQVHLIYDDYGTNAPAGLFDRLRKGGVQVVKYNPLDPLQMKTLDINKRDHRKLLVIDGETAFTGGVNIAQVYENHHASYQHEKAPGSIPWRDTDVEVSGPVVNVFDQLFVQTWAQQKGPPLLPTPPDTAIEGTSVVQALDGSPVDGHPAIYKTLLVAMAAAHSSIHLTTGFFAPPPDMIQALECAARRGVDVRVIVPAVSDSGTTVTAGRSHYEDLLKAGVHVYERHGAVLHAKTAVIDGQWSVVGSSNLDWRSVVFNNEIDAVVMGPDFGGLMEAMFSKDLAASKEITLTAWRHRGVAERLNEVRARMVESLL
ncbi:MAG TPA: phospholipase D-like domain-containing protein [Acidocella sp.]|nr:phospholipase D-like domain-containing protein [Acidocella sp.]